MSDGTIGYGRLKLVESIIKEHWKLEDVNLKKFTFNELVFVLQEVLFEEGKPYMEQHKRKSIRSGYGVFRAFTEHLMYRNLANFDSMVLITSEKGMGKSSAAIMLARQWCKMLGIKFNPKRHIAYTNADVMRKIDKLNKFEPLICDEAIRFASAADWNKRENKDLKKKLAQIRTKHLLYILCFPLKINKLEKNYLESFTNYWVDLFGRGKGAVYVKDKNPLQDSWRVKDFKSVGSYTEFTSLSAVEKKLKKHPNFWSIIKFPKPPEWLYERYLAVREKNVYDDGNILANVSKEDVHNALLVLTLRDIMLHDATLSMNRVILHLKNEYDLNIAKSVIQNAIKDAQQLVRKVQEDAIKL